MESALHVAADHPSYAGHFPGQPLLPGVVLLSEALAMVALLTGRAPDRWNLENVKFLRPVTPGTSLAVHTARTDAGSLRFEVRAGTQVVASGVLSPRD
jgi:3-hydroxymyristoyl/3-hydroxydecanoyl-(acyl carrier protein) dehydratase